MLLCCFLHVKMMLIMMKKINQQNALSFSICSGIRDLRGDLIEVFKILKVYENIDQEVFFDMSQSSLHGHLLKLNKKRVRPDVAKLSFSNRVVNEWNILDEEIISRCSLAGFKWKLDHRLRDKGGYI